MSGIGVSFCGVNFPSPLVLASGIMGLSASSLKRVADVGAGAVTAKSCGLEERKGHPCPVLVPVPHGMLNAVGLANPGVEDMVEELLEFHRNSGIPVIASVFGKSVEEFPLAARAISRAKPALIELNVSCPNVAAEFGRPFAADPELTGRITRLVKEAVTDIPILVKLSPQCPSLAQVARSCEDNGADGITAINSVGPGMLIDVNVRRPVLANRMGGLSGPAILPIAVRAVWEVFAAVKIPIIGTGGVQSTEDALQLIMAGATAVGIGTGVYSRGVEVFSEINRGLSVFLQERGLASLNSLRGAAHE
jgi:dihydroorotate dehydrogenase (NAD+) catalytic subunit